VNFHITVKCRAVDPNNCIAKVGSAIAVEPARLEYLHRLVAGGLESEAVKILTAPDMAEEPFMNIEREFTHGVS
jgi:hypothetical protein